ncbi:MAG: hypothetical protein MHM6MM_003837 [Cercozoa sp. M6MM]
MQSFVRRRAFLVRRPFSAAPEKWPAQSLLNVDNEEEARKVFDSVTSDRMRNFAIIAHIDHGKSTLSDALLQFAGNIAHADHRSQSLDTLQVEMERGITVKAQTASMLLRHPESPEFPYLLNLIDTPGHVDFSYEVSRSLAACDGALLLVDAGQGVEAQTMANYELALMEELDIVPVLTKVDLQTANVEKSIEQLQEILGFDGDDAILCSAKSGIGMTDVLDAVIKKLPAPQDENGDRERGILRARAVDSWYDRHRGAILLVCIEDGELRRGDTIKSWHGQSSHTVQEIHVLRGGSEPPMRVDRLRAGQVGALVANIRSTRDVRLGDTFYLHSQVTKNGAKQGSELMRLILEEPRPAPPKRDDVTPCAGFKEAKPMVYSSLYPVDSAAFDDLRDAIEKLSLNDNSVTVASESSGALGSGFRCGFLGVLHMDVFKQRLRDEFGAEVLVTAPTVPFQAIMRQEHDSLDLDDEGHRVVKVLSSVEHMPEHKAGVERFRQPMVKSTTIAPKEFVGALMRFFASREGEQLEFSFLDSDRVIMRFRFPLAQVVRDFYDPLKSLTRGMASFDYEDDGYEDADVVCLRLLVNKEPIDALSMLLVKKHAHDVGKELCMKLKDVISRQLFEVRLQAAVGTRIVAAETIKAFRKNVLEKAGKTVGGGDNSRKRKLLDKQKKGKAKMKQIGSVALSQDDFNRVLGGLE